MFLCVVCATHQKYVIHFCKIMLDKHDSIRVSLHSGFGRCAWQGVVVCLVFCVEFLRYGYAYTVDRR